MDRFNELERRWEERQKKRKLAITVIGGGMLVYFAVYFTLPYMAPGTPEPTPQAPTQQAETKMAAVEPAPKPEPVQKQPEPKPKPLPEPKPEPKKETLPVESGLKDPLTITLDRSFQSQIAAELEAARQKQTRVLPDETQLPEENAASSQTDTAAEPTLRIKSEAVDDSEKISLLIDNYEFDESYENAMKIARHYFASEAYPEAIKWSLAANQLNSADDESWLIFAKASIAVGETEQAKKALQAYLLKRDSLRIRQLYQSIK